MCKSISQLIIVARDMGQPVPYETTQPLQVALLDIDDNEPVFLKPPVSVRLYLRVAVYGCLHDAMINLSPQRGSLPYQKLTVAEHSPPGTGVGNVTRAMDADQGSNAVVYYFIAGIIGFFEDFLAFLINISTHHW